MPGLRFRLLSTTLVGESVTARISQRGVSSNEATVPDWQYNTMQTGGTISIVADRSTLQCAPDSARLSVDLSASTFDTPAGSGRYNPQYHDLIYIWDTGDTGTWTAPVNVLDVWKSKRHAKGPWIAHCYTELGTYTVQLTVIEPSSGKISNASIEIIVADPDTVYSGSQTVCINPVGDSDFSGAPAGATLINADVLNHSTPEFAARDGTSGRTRWLFKRGGTYDIALDYENGQNNQLHPYFGAYGTGADPIINGQSGGINGNTCIRTSPTYNGGQSSPNIADFRVSGLDFQGTFDPLTQLPQDVVNGTQNALITDKYLDLVIADCRMAGFSRPSVRISMDTNAVIARQGNTHFENLIVTNHGGQYPTIVGDQEADGSSITYTGCRLAQNPDALTDEAEWRAPIRINDVHRQHVRGCDVFSYDPNNVAAKFAYSPFYDRPQLVNVQTSSFEGGIRVIGLANNAANDNTTVHNVLIDSCVLVGSWNTRDFFQSRLTGVTARNILMIMPDTDRQGSGSLSDIYQQAIPTNDAASADDKAQPIRFYNNTFVMQRSQAGNNGTRVANFDAPADFTGIAFENNVFDGAFVENTSGDNPDAPLTSTVLWAPRNLGLKDQGDPSRTASAAAPVGSIQQKRPDTGSAAIGSAVEADQTLVAYGDIAQTERASPGRDRGAWAAQG